MHHLNIHSTLFAAGLWLTMILMMEWGRALGARQRNKLMQGGGAGIGAVEASIFALLGLLLAFTFQGAAERFDGRRTLLVQEANAIGTAWLRLDLLPASKQPELRELFRRYLDSRLDTYRKIPDMPAVEAELERTAALQKEIWQRVMRSKDEGNPALVATLVGALNEMFDIVTARTMAAKRHPPTVVFVMLAFMACAASFFAGHGMAGSKARSWVHSVGFTTVLAITVYVILDLEYPRLGLIRVDDFDRALIELRESMN